MLCGDSRRIEGVQVQRTHRRNSTTYLVGKSRVCGFEDAVSEVLGLAYPEEGKP